MKLIYAGTSDFGVPSLEHIIASRHDVLAVVTQTDKPRGRGREVRVTPVKEIALAHGIPVLQPEKLSAPESIQEIMSYGPLDVIVVVAYGQKVPTEILQWPKHGVVNVHGSILPKYRGAAPIQAAIINGETETGVTTMLMDQGWDTGDILLQRTLKIEPHENSGELSERLAALGAELLMETLMDLEEGRLAPIPQDNDLANYVRTLKRDAGAVDWSRPAFDIVNLQRGCTPKPGAYTRYGDTVVKIWKAYVIEISGKYGEPGEVIDIAGNAVRTAAGEGIVDLVEVQPQSRKRMSGSDYARGSSIEKGDRFDVRFSLE